MAVQTEPKTRDNATKLQAWARVHASPDDRSLRRLSRAELRALAEQQEGPRVSLFMPTHERGGEIKQDSLQLRSLREEARISLESMTGVSQSEAAAILSPIEELEGQEGFWRSSTAGLAILADRDGMKAVRLPKAVGPRCDVGTRFELLPLLSLLERDEFLVLAISRSQVRLYLGERDSLREVPLPPDIPQSLPDFAGHQLKDSTHQVHSAGGPTNLGGGAVYHGQGTGHDDRDAEHTQFVRAVVSGIAGSDELRELPVVVAAVKRTIAEVREHRSGLQLTDEAVVGDASAWTPETLHAAAWRCVSSAHSARSHRVLDQIAGAAATGAATDLSVILTASRQGRVDTLVVSESGRSEADPSRPRPGSARARADLEQSITHALTHGSQILVVPPQQLAEGQLAAALLRY